MNTPVKSYSFEFSSDGAATTLTVDVSLTPFNEEFQGNLPTAVLTPAVTSAFTGPVPNVTAQLNGTKITFTFQNPLPMDDNSSNLVIYTGTFLLQFGL